MKRSLRGRPLAWALAAAATPVACRSSEFVIGDDRIQQAADAHAADDASAPPSRDGAPPDDGSPPQDASWDALVDASFDAGSDRTCPLFTPAPLACDGGAAALIYDTDGCIVGQACPPLDCATAGGTCVGLAPSSCPSKRFGDAAKYRCGAGIGVGCCLPSQPF